MVRRCRQDGLIAFLLVVGSLLVSNPSKGQETPQASKALLEFWEAVYLQGAQIGYAHGLFHQRSADLIDGEEEMRLTVHRFGQPMRMEFKMTMQETADGRVRSFTHRQLMGRDEELVRTGVVEKGRLRMSKILTGKTPEEK